MWESFCKSSKWSYVDEVDDGRRGRIIYWYFELWWIFTFSLRFWVVSVSLPRSSLGLWCHITANILIFFWFWCCIVFYHHKTRNKRAREAGIEYLNSGRNFDFSNFLMSILKTPECFDEWSLATTDEITAEKNSEEQKAAEYVENLWTMTTAVGSSNAIKEARESSSLIQVGKSETSVNVLRNILRNIL